MRARLVGAVVAIAAVALGLLGFTLLSDGIGESPSADAAAGSPIEIAQITPEPVVDETDTFTAAEQTAINEMIGAYLAANSGFVREYLLANPEVLQEVVTELERQRINQQTAQQADAINLYQDLLFFSPRNAVIGNPNGDITLVEFFDYNCSYCKRALDDMNRLIADDPGLRIVLKEFPVLGLGSTEAAQVAGAIVLLAPDRYGEFHQLLLGTQAQATGDLALAAAAEIGLDVALIEAMVSSAEVSAVIEESYMLADALGLTGTPSYVLGNEVIVGAIGYDSLRGMIDSIRACGATVC
ncbi:MAG: DsbA family protein [Alphaproteobacteria bacterium]